MRESSFIIRKRIRIRSSDVRIRLKNARAARGSLLGQRPSKEATCATRPELLSGHVWHTLTTRGVGWKVTFILDNFALLPVLFKSLQFPPFVLKKKDCEIPSMIFSQIFSTSKHHNFLIRSRNWVIQVGDCSYSSPLPFQSGLAAVWLIFWEIYSENRTSSCNQGRVHNFVISSF